MTKKERKLREIRRESRRNSENPREDSPLFLIRKCHPMSGETYINRK